jgi:glycosyltransferase involved in cell wall biosynthesis
MSTLRVLFVLGTSGGGVARHVLALTTSLIRAGHQVSVGAPASVGAQFDFEGAGATFTALEIADRPHPRADVSVVRLIARLADQVDVVHAHGLRAGGLAVLGLRRKNTPLAVTLHNALLADVRTGSPVRAAFVVLERMVARRADVVLAVSADLTARLRELGAADVRDAVVPAPPELQRQATTEQVRSTLGVGSRPMVLTIARLAEQKGLSHLLDAVAILANANTNANAEQGPVFVIAGDGPLRKRLAARIAAEHLPALLLGWRDDIADLLAAADVVVSSAVWEGQPIAVQQALRAGAPIVATDVGGTQQVTGVAASLVPGGKPQELAEAIAELLANPDERSRLSALALVRAADLPDEAAALTAVVDLYRELIRRTPTPR